MRYSPAYFCEIDGENLRNDEMECEVKEKLIGNIRFTKSPLFLEFHYT